MAKKLFATLILSSSLLFGHTALMSCFDNGDGSITCEGGFSDGSSASGVKFRVEQNRKVVYEAKFDSNNEATFKKPQGEFNAIFDAGEGHQVVVKSSNIAQ